MSKNEKIRALIVDDEPLGRKMVRQMLNTHPEIEITGECQNGLDAIKETELMNPDLVFLDIHMPQINGFEYLEQLPKEEQPAIIFVTAYDEYAIRAFEVNACDYLLKPYNQERFDQALERGTQQIRHQNADDINEQLRDFLSENRAAEKFIERFIIKKSGRVFFLKSEEILWIEAEGNYVLMHTAREKHLFREAISRLAETLNPQKFQRIGRSTIVNLDFVQEMQPWFRGNYKVILRNGTELKLSPHYRENVNDYFAGSL